MASENKLPNWKASMAQEAEEDWQFQGIIIRKWTLIHAWYDKENFI